MFNFVLEFLCNRYDVNKFEQKPQIKFCMKLNKSATETLKMLLQAFAKHSLGQRQVFEWHMHFKASQVTFQDDKNSR